jgi:hypothetical protein
MRNEKYSYRAFLSRGLSFVAIDPREFNDTEIVGTCFYQEWHEDDGERIVKDIFPVGMTGVTFRDCNLDNVLVPTGCRVEGGTNKVIRVQNDLEDWVCDVAGKPVEPIAKVLFVQFGLSIDPADIPADFIRQEQMPETVYQQADLSVRFYKTPVVTKREERSLIRQIPASAWNQMTTLQKDMTKAALGTGTQVIVKGAVIELHTVVALVTIEGKGRLHAGPCLNESVLQRAMRRAV